MISKKIVILSVFIFGFVGDAIGHQNDIQACPSGQVNEIKERVVKPATFTDILSDKVVVTEGVEVITFPAEWEWAEKPLDYVRPKFVEVENIHVGAFGWNSAEVEMVFQAESHDIIIKLDGTTERRRVPAIKETVRKRFQNHPSTYYIQKVEIPFVADEMETATKIRILKKPILTIARDVEFLPKYVTDRFDITHKPIPSVTKTLTEPNVVGRIRHSAKIEKYYDGCTIAEP